MNIDKNKRNEYRRAMYRLHHPPYVKLLDRMHSFPPEYRNYTRKVQQQQEEDDKDEEDDNENDDVIDIDEDDKKDDDDDLDDSVDDDLDENVDDDFISTPFKKNDKLLALDKKTYELFVKHNILEKNQFERFNDCIKSASHLYHIVPYNDRTFENVERFYNYCIASM